MLFLVLTPPVPIVKPKANIVIALLSPNEEPVGASEWAGRWHRGDQCYVARLDGRLVHYSWVACNAPYIGEIHGTLQLKDDEAYVYDCFTDASCRGMGIFPAVLSHVGNQLFAGSVQQIWIAVEADNLSSAKAIRRAGFQEAGTVHFRRAGPRPVRSVSPVPGRPPVRIE